METEIFHRVEGSLAIMKLIRLILRNSVRDRIDMVYLETMVIKIMLKYTIVLQLL